MYNVLCTCTVYVYMYMYHACTCMLYVLYMYMYMYIRTCCMFWWVCMYVHVHVWPDQTRCVGKHLEESHTHTWICQTLQVLVTRLLTSSPNMPTEVSAFLYSTISISICSVSLSFIFWARELLEVLLVCVCIYVIFITKYAYRSVCLSTLPSISPSVVHLSFWGTRDLLEVLCVCVFM